MSQIAANVCYVQMQPLGGCAERCHIAGGGGFVFKGGEWYKRVLGRTCEAQQGRAATSWEMISPCQFCTVSRLKN